jgi:group II intron reverse transcriptase/maturase
MQQSELFFDETRLFEHLCDVNYLRAGFKTVKRNKGSPGIDGVTTEAFENRLDEELGQIQKELRDWSYKPQPVRRVDIPKPGKKDEFRMLGIPCVRDRTIQATLKILLEPIFEPTFSNNSYGFRPGRNQQQAVEAAQKIVANGKEHCVDIDLSKFFDRVQHDRLIARLSDRIADKRVLRIIGVTLRSGIMKDGLVSVTTEGTVQGSPLSPLLSNVVLDELDKELERRGLEFCRFADDCNVFVSSKNAAERAMSNITRFIEGKLKLVVNREKSKVALTRNVKFLGMTIIAATIAISAVSLQRGRDKVKELTPRGSHHCIEQTIEQINRWYVGWANYYGMTQYPAQLAGIEAHIRRRLRARIVSQQKSKRNLFKNLVKRGISRKLAAKQVFSNRRRWALSHTAAVEKAYPKQWFEQKGLKIMSNKGLAHWFDIRKWIKLT